ncbi:NAD(P)H-quinone oxidoreductase [Brevundimonas subvibrioides]|uniref:NAD(P)H quinone oxidoreductase, PIG3 family n=1 Tax=Brevundimonas subvibrioides (strain ATCC 15264 / DSM 4735 / LMG 14903 / NBRC 16000 / CB 81) TaxID=633149 RepID=D9QGA9_BRESC|nr:NAD(P)H-quinone oxidoreductase [Brevundimonas subvibrioides]ADL00725.1 NAD(P)H quinone oxidoreductase, PIG3 family [Brevundimonas subvibrioides ATCC 15264]
MKVIEIEGGSGPADALRIGERTDPRAGPGEIRIRVRAAGVNRPDLLQRIGAYPPPPGASDILGLEVAGEIDQIGEGVSRWSVGDRVCALLGGGGYAEYAVVDARHALPLPDDLDFVQAAALPETLFTVFANVFEGGRLSAGETLLIHGATSGIGVMAIQMAKAAGARVIATSRGAAKAKAALALGADVSLDATDGDLARGIADAGGADVILDMVGAAYAGLNLDALKPFGRWVVIATLTGGLSQVELGKVMMKQATLTGSTLRRRPADEKARLAAAVEARAWPWVVSGQVRPPIDATFPLDEAGPAHLRLEAGEHVGKIILTV